MKPLFVVMVTYRRFEHFKRTYEGLMPTLPEGSKVVVMHNLSEQTGEDYVKQEVRYRDYYLNSLRGDTVWCVLGQNKGWGRAMNQALSMSDDWTEYEYVLESNNDVDYEPDWFERSRELMVKYPQIGVLGLWKHPYHGVQRDLGDILIKDDMPATSWLFRSADLKTFLPFAEHGATKNRGGNGEDSAMTGKIRGLGRWVCGPKDDLAHHMDGYDIPDLGKPNPEYE